MSSRVNTCKIGTGNLGIYDGPPIRQCPVYEAMILDAKLGSESLLRALKRAGLRP